MCANSSTTSSSSSSAVIPWGQETRYAARQKETQLMFQVVDNPSLREEILKHIIIGGDKKVDHRTACNLRRVDKSWSDSVLRILWKAHEPLYQVEPVIRGNLDAFTKTFAASFATSDPPPPLKLDGPRLSQVTDRESFSSFLTTCGPALLQLGLVIHDHRLPLPDDLPPWTLPRLHKLKMFVALRHRALLAAAAVEQPEAEVTVEENMPLRLIKAIFRCATALAELNLSVDKWPSGGDIADVTIFESVTFPPTLVKLILEMDLGVQQSKIFVNAFLRSSLPNVTSLTVIVWYDVFSEGILFSLMDKWKTGLKNLVIVGKEYAGPPRNVSTVRFPVMSELEQLSMSSVSVEWGPGLRSLEGCFPKLHTLRLRLQSPGMLRTWTEFSKFSKVTSLELILADGNFNPDDDPDDFLVSVDTEALQLVNLAFPNLRKLAVGISISDPGGLRYVFQEMRQLVTLKVKVFGELSERRTTHVWDSILTGVPLVMMASKRRNGPGSRIDGEAVVSIANLQELRSFYVEDDASFNHHQYPVGRASLISDSIFDHAFFKMPKLTHLHFEGPFTVSEELADRWMRGQEGRSFVYQLVSNNELQ